MELFCSMFSNAITDINELNIKHISEVNSHTVLINTDHIGSISRYCNRQILVDHVLHKYSNCDTIIIDSGKIFDITIISKDKNNFITLYNKSDNLPCLYNVYASYCKSRRSIKLSKKDFKELILGSDKLSDYIRICIYRYYYGTCLFHVINRCITPRNLHNALCYDIINNDKHVIRAELNFNKNINLYYLKNNLRIIKLYCKTISGKNKIIPGSITISKVNNEFLYCDTYRVCIDFEK